MKQYTTMKYAPFVSILTVVFYFILPRQLGLITYYVPVIFISWMFSRNGKGFNWWVFFFLLFISVAIPTGFFTLDVTDTNFVLPASQPTIAMIVSWQFWINLIVIILIFVLPMLMIGSALWAMYMGQVEEGTSALMKAGLVMIMFLVLMIILDWFGLVPAWFFWTYIRDFFIWLIQIFAWMGQSIGKMFEAVFTWSPQEMPAFPSFPDLGGQSLSEIASDGDVLFPALSSDLSNPNSIYTVFLNVNGAIPLVIAGLIFWIWILQRRGHDPYLVINRYLAGQDKQKSMTIQLVKFNAPAIIFGTLVLLYGFASFLNLTNTGFDTGIYTIITIFCLLLVIIGAIPLKTGNLQKTLEGTLFGIGGVFFFYNMLSTGLSVLEFQEPTFLTALLNQLFFTAPTESLIFHVTIPGVGLVAVYYIYQRLNNRDRLAKLDKQILDLELRQSKLRELLNQAQMRKNSRIKYRGQVLTQTSLSLTIFSMDNQIKLLQTKKKQTTTITLNKLIFGKPQYLILTVLLCILLPNFVFSSWHIFRSNLNFFDFWVSGIGMVYLGAGAWLTFISIKYGWLPCILAHFGINAISLIMMGLYV